MDPDLMFRSLCETLDREWNLGSDGAYTIHVWPSEDRFYMALFKQMGLKPRIVKNKKTLLTAIKVKSLREK